MRVYLKTRGGKWILIKGWLKQVSPKPGRKTVSYALLGEESTPPEIEGAEEIVLPAPGFSKLLRRLVDMGDGMVVVEPKDVENLYVRARREVAEKVLEVAKELGIID
jgi:hypothetical protein